MSDFPLQDRPSSAVPSGPAGGIPGQPAAGGMSLLSTILLMIGLAMLVIVSVTLIGRSLSGPGSLDASRTAGSPSVGRDASTTQSGMPSPLLERISRLEAEVRMLREHVVGSVPGSPSAVQSGGGVP